MSSSRAKFLVTKEIGIFSRYFLPENYKSSESPSFSKENIWKTMPNKVNILKGKDLQHRFKEHKNRLHWYSAFQATCFVDDHFDPQKYITKSPETKRIE